MPQTLPPLQAEMTAAPEKGRSGPRTSESGDEARFGEVRDRERRELSSEPRESKRAEADRRESQKSAKGSERAAKETSDEAEATKSPIRGDAPGKDVVEAIEELREQAESGEVVFSFLNPEGGASPEATAGLNPHLGMKASAGMSTTGQQTTLQLFQSMMMGDNNGRSGQGPGLSRLFSGPSMLSNTGNAEELLAFQGRTADFSSHLSARLTGLGEQTMPGPQSLSSAALTKAHEGMAPLRSYSTSVDVPVQQAEWGEKVAGKLAWLTNQRLSQAEIHIIPPDLGPLDVRVQVQNDQASVTVHAAHPTVRDQLELNGHRLRDMLQDNGLSLDRFEVSSDGGGQQAQADSGAESESDGGNSGSGPLSGTELAGEGESDTSGELDLTWRGEVDLYA